MDSFADYICTAPKKKAEKMQLGEFLQNQCEYPIARAFRVTKHMHFTRGNNIVKGDQ